MITVLVPLSRFRVPYELGSGKPFSKLDLYILRAIGQGIDTAARLEKYFQLPQRLIVEVLVNLFHEGWVQMTSRGFQLTPKGSAGLQGKIRPEGHRVDSESSLVMMERVTGALIGAYDIVWDSESGLRHRGVWDQSVHLRCEFFGNALDEGQVLPYLPRKGGDWIRNVSRPVMETRDWHWMILEADVENARVFGLPQRWAGRLKETVVDAASRAPDELKRQQRRRVTSRVQRAATDDKAVGAWSVVFDPARHCVIGADAHRAYLRRVFESARSNVLLCSSRLNRMTTELRELLEAALSRGLSIDVYWGSSDEQLGQTRYPALVDYLRLAEARAQAKLPGILRISEIPTESGANVLIYDGSPTYGMFTSFPWLGGAASDEQHIGLEVSHPGVLAETCLSIVRMIVDAEGRVTAGGSDRWRRRAADLGREAIDLPDRHAETASMSVVRVLHNQEQVIGLRELERTAQSRLGIWSSEFGEGGPRRLERLCDLQATRPAQARIDYGRATSDAPQQMAALLAAAGVECAHRPGLGANVVIADETMMLCSQPLLRSASKDKKTSWEVGLQIEQGAIVDYVWHALGA